MASQNTTPRNRLYGGPGFGPAASTWAEAAGAGMGPPSAGGTSLRKNAAPSIPPSVEKIAPAHSSRKKSKAYSGDDAVAHRLEQRRARQAACRGATRINSLRDTFSERRQDDVEPHRDDEPDERADDAGKESGERAAPDRRLDADRSADRGRPPARPPLTIQRQQQLPQLTTGSADRMPMNSPPSRGA